MTVNTMKNTFLLLYLAVFGCSAGAAFSGSTDPGGTGAMTEEAVTARSQAYLEALRLNDLASAYSMELGSVDGTLTPMLFRQRVTGAGLLLRQYEILSATVDGATAEVEARLAYRFPELRKLYRTTGSFEWIERDGKLYCRVSPVNPGTPEAPSSDADSRADPKD